MSQMIATFDIIFIPPAIHDFFLLFTIWYTIVDMWLGWFKVGAFARISGLAFFWNFVLTYKPYFQKFSSGLVTYIQGSYNWPSTILF